MNEIAYILDPQETYQSHHVAIHLAILKKEGFNHSLTTPSLPFAKWKSLAAQESDQKALTALLKEELLFQQKTKGRSSHNEQAIYHSFHISQSQAKDILTQLGMIQKLYFKDKQLIVDFLGRVDLYHEIISLDSQRIEVKTHLKWREKDILLQDCDCIGPGKPHWFIKGLSLKGISTSISWKALQEAYHTRPWIMEGAQKSTFLNTLDPEDPDSPQIVTQGESLKDLSQQASPHPLLILKDRLGSFADLWMDYGQSGRVALHDTQPSFKNRQLSAEQAWEKDLLETDFIKKAVGSSHYYCPLDKVAKSLTFLLEIGWTIEDWKGNRVVKQDALNLSVEEMASALTIKGNMHYGSYEADVSSVLGAFNRRERFIQLGSGTVGLLPDIHSQPALQELAEEGEIMGPEVRVKKSRFGSLADVFKQAHMPPSLTALKNKWETFAGIERTDPSEAFKGHLRPYQQDGLNWLSFLLEYGFHGILADEMGLGKTVQVLAFLSRLPTNAKHLIVVPTSLIFNWKNEIHRFLPHLPCYIHQGPERSQSLEQMDQPGILLMSYTTLRLDLALLQKLSFFMVILDEAQMIKNAHTQTAQAVCSLQAQFRLCLTGTPIENHLGELWSHFRFLIPDLFGSEDTFLADVQAAQADRRYLDRIRKKVHPFILRRLKTDVAKDLPPRLDQTLEIEMGEEQRQFYDRFLASFKGQLLKKVETEGISKHRLEILEALLRLRQICCHPLLVSSLSDEVSCPGSAKFDAFMQDLQTLVEEEKKVLVYSQFTSMLKLMTRYAKEQKWAHVYLDGSTTNREEVVRQFQEEDGLFLFFISLKAGGVGLNLTAADYVFLYDPWWNEAVEEQAINRAHRIGRQSQVIAKRFIVVESIEEKMMKLKAAKRGVVEEIFDTESLSTTLTLEDLYDLLT